MKLLSFDTPDGPRLGRLDPEGVTDLSATLGEEIVDVRTLLEGPGLEAGRAIKVNPTYTIDALTLRPPVHEPRRILCIGVNYPLHRQETGRVPTEHPVIFTRFASTLVASGGALVRPAISERFDYEGELAVIIGRRGRHIKEDAAYDYIAGYACFNDGSVRDWQRHTSQFTPGKNFDFTGGFGPWMVTANDVPDPHNLDLQTRLNGTVMQSARTSEMTFRIPNLIRYISAFTTLEPGDVIATGTPSGVGDKRKPPVYMKPTDTVEVDIETVGVLTNRVVNEADARVVKT